MVEDVVSEERWFDPEDLRARLSPLPEGVISAVQSGRSTTALSLAEQFQEEWLPLEDRLAALGVGYMAFLQEELPPGSLDRANAWVNKDLASEFDAVQHVPPEERREALKRVIGRIPGYEVTRPPRPDGFRFSSREVCQALIEAIRAGESEAAVRTCEELLTEWPYCQDRLVHLCAVYSTFIAGEHDEAEMNRAHLWVSAHAAEAIHKIIDPNARYSPGYFLQVLSLLRAHTMQGSVTEEDDRLVIDLDCSSGLRMWRRNVEKHGMTAREAPWTFGRERLPYYCCRCTANIMSFPRERGDEPLWIIEPPTSAEARCKWIVPKKLPSTPNLP
jgi:hypothetical protein